MRSNGRLGCGLFAADMPSPPPPQGLLYTFGFTLLSLCVLGARGMVKRAVSAKCLLTESLSRHGHGNSWQSLMCM